MAAGAVERRWIREGVMADEDQQWWYNSRTGEVERGKQSNAIDRVGPFATEDEARRAPERLRENAARWAAEDAADDNWGRGA